jgi:hypothetical protein
MEFKPRTEQEIADSRLLKKGEYDFEVLDATEKTSKAGHPMIELKLRVWSASGGRVLTDYLLAETPAKLRGAAAACGLLTAYETGSLSDNDFKGKRGRLKLGIEKAKNGFPAKNTVGEYLAVGSRPARVSDDGAINFRV